MTCNRDKTITLDTGKQVCNYCPDYASECLAREKKARQLLAMTPNAAKIEWARVGNGKLAKVVKRLRIKNGINGF